MKNDKYKLVENRERNLSRKFRHIRWFEIVLRKFSTKIAERSDDKIIDPPTRYESINVFE